MKLVIYIALAAATLAGSAVQAQAPLLFSPLSGAEKTVVRAENEEYLREQLYFAQRHRIVRVNTELLYPPTDAHEAVTINLFDDAAFTYTKSTAKSGNQGNSFAWQGTLENPGYSAAYIEQIYPGISPEFAALLRQTEFGLRIGGALHVYDQTSDRFWPAFRINQHYTDYDGNHIEPRELDPNAPKVYAILLSLVDPITRSTYRVEALNDDPRLHLVMELDPDKVFIPVIDDITGDAGRRETTPDSKRQAYEEFRRSLTDESEARKRAEMKDFFDYMKSLQVKDASAGN